MLNLLLGSVVKIEGATCIATTTGAHGHAVYGDFLDYPAGHYAVEFEIAPVQGQRFRKDVHCAEIDVTLGNDTLVLARRDISLFDLRDGSARFVLTFELPSAGRLQFRVGVNGAVPLIIADHRPIAMLTSAMADAAVALDTARFPKPNAPDAPPFLKTHASALRHYFEHGIGVRVVDGEVVLMADEVSFLARVPDDILFVGELFLENTYNFNILEDTCVIDIGMNSGLVALLMAKRLAVKEVHAFEPFAETMMRARENIAINPDVAHKITTYQLGLSDHDEEGTLIVPDMGNSGAMTIRQIGHGIPVSLSIRDAAGLLGPIIDAAIAKNRRVMMKVDCEGSEFAIFDSLEKAGLLEKISAFMVEWHRVYDNKSQADLLDPLLRRGFITFDRSPKTGNGFFYAVQAG